MSTLAFAAAGFLLVMMLPGALVFRIAHPSGRLQDLIALSPALSLAVVFLLGEIGMLVHFPFNPTTFTLLVVALAIVAAYRRATGARREVASPPSVAPSESTLSATLLVLGVVIGCLVWAAALRGVPEVPPNEDSTYHGFITARIVERETFDPAVVMVTDEGPNARATVFYPLGLHGPAALVHRITGISIAAALTMENVAFAAAVFPVGMFFLARFLVPDRPLVAGFTSLLAPALIMFPYKPIQWGGIALTVGMALVPAAVTYVGRTIFKAWSVADATLAALLLTAMFATHTSEIPLMVLLLASLAVGQFRAGLQKGFLRRTAARALAVAAASAVLIAPMLPQIPGGVAERSAINDKPLQSLGAALREVVTLHIGAPAPQLILAILAGLGILLAISRRRYLGWALAATLSLGLYALAATSKGFVSRWLTLPWYRQPERLAYNLALFVSFFGAVFIASVAVGASRLINPKRFVLPASAALLAGAVVLFVNFPAARSINRFQQTAYRDFSPIGKDEMAAFSYISSRIKPGERVLNDINTDGSLWMYAISNLSPVFWLSSSSGFSRRSWNERVYLADHIHELGKNTVRELAAKYHVAFVYVDETGFLGANRHIDLPGLQSNRELREVFRKGPAHVFELQD